ncbi:hypothetical protein GW17_00041230 [Ensete ventricosum]|nr:hypothetical protein GW17_00041230 [Ensete ventricosum]
MQRQEGLWIQVVNVIVSQRRVFRVCALKLALDESLGHQHMRVVYHRGRSQIASTSESHGGDLIIQRGGTSVESSIPCSHGRRALVVKGGQGGGVCKGKLQVPRQDGRTEAKELHKTGVDELLIKIVEIEGLWVDVGVLY